jgi:Putative zinc-finger
VSDCQRVISLLPELVDGDLSIADTRLVESHLKTCPECSARLATFARVDASISNWSGYNAPPLFGQRERLAGKMLPHHAPSRGWAWAIPVALAAGLAAVWFIPQKTPAPPRISESRFIEIPYLAPLAPNENTTVVRMDLQVATLQAAGYRVNADPAVTVPVDVLVGEDGRPHALRVLADIDVNGAGD